MAKIKQRADGRYMISVYLGKDSSGKELTPPPKARAISRKVG